MRSKPCLSLSIASTMMDACKKEAAKNNWNVSIAIVDDAGFLIALERLDGAGLQSPEIAMLKAKTSAIGKVPTKLLEEIAKDRPGTLTFPGRLPVQGGVPLIYKGECVGAIGVSGVKSPEDEQVALAGQNVFLAL